MSRFLVIGLDGAEPSLVEQWMSEGRLPNLSALRARGAYMPLASTTPPATFPAWTTCATGVNPGRHGIFDFTELEAQRTLRFVNASDRQAPAVWNILSEADKRVCVLGVPATWPPEPVNGYMVSGFDSPVCTRIDKSFVYPETLYPDVKAWRFADFQESRIHPGWHEDALHRLLKGVETKEAIACDLMAREPWDFFMVVFGESDTVSHHFWLFHDTQSPRHYPGPSDAIRRVYERLDAAAGRLIETAGDDCAVAIVSDHGFGGAGTGVVHINNWLAEHGYLTFTKPHDNWLKQLALRCVPGRLQGSLFRKLKGLAANTEAAARTGGIDWQHTFAWSEELNYFPSIRINRDALGQTSYTDFCRQLRNDLASWEVIERTWHRDELYEGTYVDRAPDIILQLSLENGYSYSCIRARGGSSFRRLSPSDYVGGKERGMTGNHRPNGILFLSEPTSAQEASLLDIAPTILGHMDVAAPPMDGVSLLSRVEAGETHWTPPTAAAARSNDDTEAWAERLRGLGYFE